MLKAIELGLLLKFRDKGLLLYPEISKVEDVDVLQAIVEALKVADDLSSIIALYSTAQRQQQLDQEDKPSA